jgi:hypothetical protein
MGLTVKEEFEVTGWEVCNLLLSLKLKSSVFPLVYISNERS